MDEDATTSGPPSVRVCSEDELAVLFHGDDLVIDEEDVATARAWGLPASLVLACISRMMKVAEQASGKRDLSISECGDFSGDSNALGGSQVVERRKGRPMRWQTWAVMLVLAVVVPVATAAAPPASPEQVARQRRQIDHLVARAVLLTANGQFEQALGTWRQVVRLRERWHGKGHWRVTGASDEVERLGQLAALPAASRESLARAFRQWARARFLASLSRYREAGECLAEALKLCREALGDGDRWTATFSAAVAETLQSQAQYARAQVLYEKALAIRRKALGEAHPETATAYNNLAHCLAAQGKYAQAQPLFEKALAICRKARGEDHPDTASAWNSLASNLDDLGLPAKAQPLYARALALRRKLLGEEHPHTAMTYNNSAYNLQLQGKYAQALPLYEKALALRRKVLGEEHPDTATAYTNLASVLSDLGQHLEAQPLYQKALAIDRKVLGEQHRQTASSYNNLATNLDDLGRLAEAQPLYEKALAVRRKVLGEDHPETATSYHNLASNLNSQGRHALVQPLYERGLLIRRRALGENHPETAMSYNGLANCLHEQGKLALAQQQYEKALAIRRKALGEEHPLTAASYSSLAACLADQGKQPQAQVLYEKALAIRRRTLPEDHPDLAESWGNLGACLFVQDKAARARSLFEQALAGDRKALGENHPHTLASYNNLAGAFWLQGRRREAVRLWQVAAAGHEASRRLATSGGFERAQFRAMRLSPHEALAVGFARLGMPRSAWKHAEANLARGLLDDLAAAGEGSVAEVRPLQARLRSLDERLIPLLTAGELPADRAERRDQLLRQRRQVLHRLARLKAEVSAGLVLPLADVQRHIPADAALLTWVDVPGLGERWACLLRRQGPPLWQALTGSGPGGAWTRRDSELPDRLGRALASPDGGDPAPLAAALRQQRLEPLRSHLGAVGELPAVRRLLVVPTGRMGTVPVEVLAPDLEVSYVPSGTVFARLMQQHRTLSGSPLLALGDPVFAAGSAALPEPPAYGVMLRVVLPGGKAARGGLRPGDVLLSVGTRRLLSAEDLKSALASLPARVEYWRDGRQGTVRLEAGSLGAVIDERSARAAVRARRRQEAPVVQRGSYQRLPGTRVEVLALSRLLPRCLTLLGSLASEQQLDRMARADYLKRFRLIHLATHGQIDPRRPERSCLILAQDRLPDALEQARLGRKVCTGRLDVGTILREWRLDCDLVVLSACQTALGREAGGEGLLGFAQAFLSRGARSVVLSRWKVDDTATALLMVRFYENLLGKRKELKKALGRGEALGEAKKWLAGLERKEAGALAARLSGGVLRGTEKEAPPVVKGKPAKLPAGDRPFAHPYYWAAFVLVGDPA